jgi:hypothetical protein
MSMTTSYTLHEIPGHESEFVMVRKEYSKHHYGWYVYKRGADKNRWYASGEASNKYEARQDAVAALKKTLSGQRDPRKGLRDKSFQKRSTKELREALEWAERAVVQARRSRIEVPPYHLRFIEEVKTEIRKRTTANDPSPRRLRKTRKGPRGGQYIPPTKRRKISQKIRLLREEAYPERQAIAIAMRMHGIPRPNRPVKHLTATEKRQSARARRRGGR